MADYRESPFGRVVEVGWSTAQIEVIKQTDDFLESINNPIRMNTGGTTFFDEYIAPLFDAAGDPYESGKIDLSIYKFRTLPLSPIGPFTFADGTSTAIPSLTITGNTSAASYVTPASSGVWSAGRFSPGYPGTSTSDIQTQIDTGAFNGTVTWDIGGQPATVYGPTSYPDRIQFFVDSDTGQVLQISVHRPANSADLGFLLAGAESVSIVETP